MAESIAAVTPTGSLPERPSSTMTYGRSRLVLGVSGVGTWVVLGAVALAAGVPGWVAGLTGGDLGLDLLAIVGLSIVVLLVQAPFDLLGGYVLPRRHGRSSDRFAGYAAGWLRGVAAYQAAFMLVGLLLLGASRGLGVTGMVLVGVAATVALLFVRTPLARLVGGLRRVEAQGSSVGEVSVLASSDVGFTGGVEGVVRARRHVVARGWMESLTSEMYELALRRRREAVASGLWLRGRVASLAFVWVGFVIAGSQVGGLAGTSGGVLAFAATFTLWSFFGLLVLPTFSRRGSMMVDRRLIDQGVSGGELSELAGALDSMQDGEPDRPRWIERVFHPIPNVTSRGGDHGSFRFGAWDVARTSAFLGVAGLSPLGRAVHCNSGRPSLWVYLPLD